MSSGSNGRPSPRYRQAFARLSAQGQRFEQPVALDGRYYGFLSKADFDEATNTWDVFFELVNMQYYDNVLLGRSTTIRASPPRMPALAYHIRNVAEGVILKTLGLTSTDYLAEGSWYELALSPGAGSVTGDLYDPDLDLIPGS